MGNRWETVETVSDFIFGGSKITADGDCSHEIKRHLLLGRKVMTNLDSIFKSRDITLPTKVRLVKAMIFPVVMYGCESWTVKKAECWKIHAFELWCWRRLLRVPWTARRSNQSILKISPGISLEGMMLKLKLQYFGHLMQRVDSLEKTLMLGGIGGRRKRGQQRIRWLDGITDSMDVSLGEGGLVCCDSWGRKESDTTERLNWTELILSSVVAVSVYVPTDIGRFIYLFLVLLGVFIAAPGLSLIAVSGGYSLVVVHRLLTTLAFFCCRAWAQ